MVAKTPNRRRWWIAGVALVAFVLLHLAIDGLYTAYVHASSDAWADSVEVNDRGVLAECDAYELPPAEPATHSTAVLLVHGFNASPRHWDFVAPALADRGLCCRVMRLPGFAEPGALHDDRDYRLWTEAVAQELARLRADHDRVVVVGHSLGGATVLRVLLDDPKSADAGVLVAPAIAVSNARAPVLSTRAWREVSKRTLVFTNVVKTPFPMDCTVEGRTDWPGRMPYSSMEVIDALFAMLDRNLPDAEKLATPVTVVVSPNDHVVDTAASLAYFERIGSEGKRLVEFAESGHAIPLDREWERLVDLIAERALGGGGVPVGEAPANRQAGP